MSYRPEDTNILDVVDVDLDTFQVFIDKVNQVVDHLRNTVVTVSNTSAYDGNNTGNGFVFGVFGSNVAVVTNSLRGGNVSTTNVLTITSGLLVSNNATVNGAFTVTGLSNLNTLNVRGTANIANTLSVTGNTSVGDQLTVAGNTNLNSAVNIKNTFTFDAFSNSNLGATVASPLTVYSYPKASWTTGKVLLQTKRGANVQSFESIVVHDGTTPYMQIYGVAQSPMTANNGVFSVAANTTHILLQFQQSGVSTAVNASINLVK